jgi:SecD/SecF fusion protein
MRRHEAAAISWRRGASLVGAGLLVAALWLLAPGAAAHAQAQQSKPTRITLSLNLADVPEDQQDAVSAQTVRVFLERLLGLGVPDPVVLQQAGNSVAVDITPDVDVDDVVATLTGRGLVEFREPDERGSGWKRIEERGVDGTLKPLTSAYFEPTSTVILDPNRRQPLVSFHLNDEGAMMMEAASRRLLDKPIGIFYDEHLVIAPVVRSVLRSEGVIAGLSGPAAKRLAVQLNSGALPVDVTLQAVTAS